jgi:hypothetical protein
VWVETVTLGAKSRLPPKPLQTGANDGRQCGYGNPATREALVKGDASTAGTPMHSAFGSNDDRSRGGRRGHYRRLFRFLGRSSRRPNSRQTGDSGSGYSDEIEISTQGLPRLFTRFRATALAEGRRVADRPAEPSHYLAVYAASHLCRSRYSSFAKFIFSLSLKSCSSLGRASSIFG